MTRRELFQPQANRYLGRYWFFLHPAVTIIIFFLVFGYVFKVRSDGASLRSSEVYLLSGLIPWVIMSELMVRACTIVQANANLVKQIIFPIEALIMKSVLAAVLIQLIMSVVLFALLLATSDVVNPLFIVLWVAALLVQTIFMTGFALTLASVTPFVPDIEDVIAIFARAGLFLTPVLYLPTMFSRRVWQLFDLNPFSYFIWIHHNAIYDQAVSSPEVWVGAILIAATALLLGAWLFRALSASFGDVV